MEKVCPECGGTGFVKDEDGRVKFCRCRFESRDVVRSLGIPARFWDASLDNFEIKNSSDQNALTQSRIFVANYRPNSGEGITFVGPPGVGKTHLAVGILKELHRKGVRGYFFDTKDLIYRLKLLIEEGGKTGRAIKRILNLPVIVLDDLGSERLSDWQRELISYIISYRYNNLKSTIITTNYNLSSRSQKKKENTPRYELEERLGTSIVSRIYHMNKEPVIVEGDDKRKDTSHITKNLY